MAPGVGKTFRMLEEGHRRVARGTDLVVGFVEAHGRPHTLELLDGLEVVPRRRDRVPGRRGRGDGHGRRHRAGAHGRADRRAGPHQRPRVGAREALGGRGAHPRRRHPRRDDDERPAPRDTRRCRRDHHRGARQRAPARRGHRDRRRDRARGHEPRMPCASACATATSTRPIAPQVALDRFFTESNLTALREISLRLVARRVEGQLEDRLAGRLVPLVTRTGAGAGGRRARPRAARFAALPRSPARCAAA